MTKKEIGILKKQFGAYAREIRLNKGLTVRKVAYHCNLDNSKISKIELGKSNIALSTLVELAQGLGVHPSELFRGDFDWFEIN